MFRTFLLSSLIALSLGGTLSTFTTAAYALLPAVQSPDRDLDDDWGF
jgi:hypothetical protein